MWWLVYHMTRLIFLTWQVMFHPMIPWHYPPSQEKMYQNHLPQGSNPCPQEHPMATFSPFSKWFFTKIQFPFLFIFFLLGHETFQTWQSCQSVASVFGIQFCPVIFNVELLYGCGSLVCLHLVCYWDGRFENWHQLWMAEFFSNYHQKTFLFR